MPEPPPVISATSPSSQPTHSLHLAMSAATSHGLAGIGPIDAEPNDAVFDLHLDTPQRLLGRTIGDLAGLGVETGAVHRAFYVAAVSQATGHEFIVGVGADAIECMNGIGLARHDYRPSRHLEPRHICLAQLVERGYVNISPAHR